VSFITFRCACQTRTCKPVNAPCGGELLPYAFANISVRKHSPVFIIAQRIRASLFASAHRNQPRRLLRQQPDNPVAQGAFALTQDVEQRGRPQDQHLPYVSVALLGYASERLLAAARVLSRREARKAAKSRPDLNTLGSGTLAAITEAMSFPMPGTLSSNRLISFCAWALEISFSRSSIALSSPSRA